MSMKFGDPVMNIAASDANPVKYGVFRRRIHRDVEYMTNDGHSHRTPAHNLVKTGINPADKIDLLVKALQGIIEGDDAKHWEGDSLSDAIDAARAILAAVGVKS